MSEDSSFDATETGPATFPSRLRGDVMSAQQPSDSYPSAEESAGQTDAPARASLSVMAEPPLSAPGLSLSAIARAERDLQRPATIAFGGSHVSFTEEDVHRMRDPAVLRLLQDNSRLFAKYQHGVLPTSEQAAAPSATPSAASLAETERSSTGVEADLLDLQRAIETFITAVDEDGKRYQILTDDEGNVVVPVEEDDAAASTLLDGDELRDEEEGLPGNQNSFSNSTSVGDLPTEEPSSPAASTDAAATDDVVPYARERVQREDTVLRPPKKGPTTARPFVGSKGRPRGGPQVQRKMEASPLASAANVTDKHDDRQKKRTGAKASAPPRRPVRPVRTLLPEEEERIDRLLSTNFAAESQPAEITSPFSVCEETQRRLEAIDERLSTLRVVRRAPPAAESTDDEQPENETVAAVSAPSGEAADAHARVSAVRDAARARAIGNQYMHQAKADRRREHKRAAVNASLLRVQAEMNEIELLADALALPEDIRSLRPAWACSTVQLPCNDDVAALLEEAAEEQERCAVLGAVSQTSCEPASDPYAALLSALSEARARASSLLEAVEPEVAKEPPPRPGTGPA